MQKAFIYLLVACGMAGGVVFGLSQLGVVNLPGSLGGGTADAAVAGSYPSLGGPSVAGLCVLSRDTTLTTSAVGKVAAQRLGVLTDEAHKEVAELEQALSAQLKALDDQKKTLPEAEYAKRRNELAVKLGRIQGVASLRSNEIEATRLQALGRISKEAEPVIASVYSKRGCGMLIERSAVLAGNAGSDITSEVIAALDAKIKTITFDRVKLDAPAKTAQSQTPATSTAGN